MIKRILSLLMILLFVLMPSVYAIDMCDGYIIPIDIEINGKFIKCAQKSFIDTGVTYIPLRAFADAISAEISWNPDTHTAIMQKDGHSFEFSASDAFCTIDGQKKDCKTLHYNGLTFIPIRAISQTLGYNVSWDNTYFVVKIDAPGIFVPEDFCDYSYSYEDILYLSKITMLEAGSGGMDMRIAICNTVLNRVNSKLFPHSVKEVVFDTKYGVQFPPAHTARMNEMPPVKNFIAAKCALNGINLAGNSFYFISTKAAPSSWAHQNRPFYKTIESTNFYE